MTAISESRRRALGGAFPLLASTAWGVMYVVSKYSFGYMPPLTLCLIRVALGSGALVGLLLWRGEPLPRRKADLGAFLWLGFLVAVFFFARPVVGALLGWLMLHEVLGWPFIVGGLIVAAGILCVSWPEAA